MSIEGIHLSVTLFGSTIVFLVGYYVFLKDSKGPANRLFFLTSLAGTLYGLGEGLAREPTGIWGIIAWTGVSFLPGLFLHLILVITGKKEILQKREFLFLLYFFSILLLLAGNVDLFVKEETVLKVLISLTYIYLAIYYLSCFLSSITLLLKKYFSSVSFREKTKLKNFLIGVLIPIIGGMFFNIIYPYIYLFLKKMGASPPSTPRSGIGILSSLSFIIGYLFTARGIIVWRIFIDYRDVLEAVFTRLTELVIITDKKGIILLTNEITLSKLKYKEEEIIGLKIEEMLKGGKEKFKEIQNRLAGTGEIFEDRIYFLTKEKEEIPFLLTLSPTKEGIVYIGADIREFIDYQEKLEKEVWEKKKELEEAKTILEVKVQTRKKELIELTQILEERVKERTRELQERLIELEMFQRLSVGRELKLSELKRELEELKKKLDKNG